MFHVSIKTLPLLNFYDGPRETPSQRIRGEEEGLNGGGAITTKLDRSLEDRGKQGLSS